MSPLEKQPCSTYVVRFGDCDPFGHLNNSRYLDYLINAREDHLMKTYNWDFRHYAKLGLGWVVQQHEIIYLQPAKAYETVGVQSAVIGLHPHYVQVECSMFDQNYQSMKALLWTRYYHVNIATGKKAEHTPELLDYFGQLKIEGVGPGMSLKERLAQLTGRTATVDQ
jgi:acyl-CoA thioesterase FadM